MAVKYAIQAGNWSDIATWNGGTIPQDGDSVHAGGFHVEIDMDLNLPNTDISTRPNGAADGGGYFQISNDRVIILKNIYGGVGICLYLTGTNKTISVTAVRIEGSDQPGSNYFGIKCQNISSNITITADLYGGTAGSDCYALRVSSDSSIVTIVGNCYGGQAVWSTAVYCEAGITNIVGNVIGGTNSSAAGVACDNLNATLNIVGNVSGSSSSPQGIGIYAIGGVVNVTGNVASIVAVGISIISATVTINGDVTAGNNNGAFISGYNSSLTINGSISASSLNQGLYINNPSAQVYIRKVNGMQGSNIFHSVWNYGGTQNLLVEEVEMGDSGQWPINGFSKFPTALPIKKMTIRLSDGSALTLSSNVGMPVQSNVKKGVVYDSGNKTGTLEVPPKESVAVGVPVGDEIGEAIFTFNDWLAALAYSNDPLAIRLRNVSTVQTNGAQLESALNS